MIQFKPFKGVRPAKNKASHVASQNIYNYEKDEIEKILATNPESYLQIIKSTLLPSNASSQVRFQEVRRQFDEFMEENIITQDNKSYYIYEQEQDDGIKSIGILGVVSIDDYLEGRIKKHEETLKVREETFADYLVNTHLQAEPILLTFPENQSVELLFSMVTRKTPSLEFKGNDGNLHRFWQVKDRLVMKQLKTAIEKIPNLYIADGHHRMGSSAHYTLKMRENDPEFYGGEDYNYAMALLIPGNFINIYDYNRLLKDLNGMSAHELLEKIAKVFEVIEKDEPYFPTHKHHISMYLDGKYYNLYVPQKLRGVPKGLGELDTYLLEEHLLKPIFGIDDSRTSKKVEFEKGTGDIKGILNMKKKVDSGEFMAAFGFYPISIHDLFLVADENQSMPPKSTFITPKLLSGLTIFDQKE